MRYVVPSQYCPVSYLPFTSPDHILVPLSVSKGNVIIAYLIMYAIGNKTRASFRFENDLIMFPNVRGLHIHNTPVKDLDCIDTGSHWDNNQSNTHGSGNSPKRHHGDIGNINPQLVNEINFNTRFSDIIGHHQTLSAVLHTDTDDYGLTNHPDSLTTGNSGSRYACGNLLYRKQVICDAGSVHEVCAWWRSLHTKCTLTHQCTCY